ncbi:hypothetical protein [Jejuia spongiicola]|uniref:Uncharacterized protein n=1 Tax=Jejuia spongiicola TaxID=2942207 RepID=A0ABT0QAA0_9FLAO|nr:hypothetical protein [Jejuia spongiicola]MCL6293907.1 hypothetical protein [Jejuia spongiicola]
MAFSSEQVWAKFYEKLVQTAVPNFDKTKQAVSIAGTTLSADIVNADPDISNANIYNIGNLLPAASASYAPGGDLITSYSLFLQNIDLGGDSNPALQKKINVAAANVNSNQTNYTKVFSEAMDQFIKYKTIDPSYTGGFDEWANTNYPVYASAKTSLNGAIADYDALMVKAHGAGYTTIQAAQASVSALTGAKELLKKNPYNMPVKVGSVAPAGGTPVLPGQDPSAPPNTLTSTFRPAFSVGGGLANVFSAWETESVNKNFPVSIALSGNFADGNYRDFGWSESVSASYRSWFSVKVNQQASYQSVNQDWKQSSFNCKVSFNGLQSFPINPDANWFSSGIIQNFKDKLLSTSPQFFGEGGSLNVIPSSIILGLGLKIEITVDNASYTSLKTAFQQSASVSVGIGPFSFSGSESSHLNTSNFTYNDDSNTIVINPGPTDVPLLLGVVSDKY